MTAKSAWAEVIDDDAIEGSSADEETLNESICTAADGQSGMCVGEVDERNGCIEVRKSAAANVGDEGS